MLNSAEAGARGLLQHTSFCAGRLNATSGDDVTIHCSSSTGYPSWTGPEVFNGKNIQYNNPGSSVFNRDLIPEQKRTRLSWASNRMSLVIKNVTVTDEGLYICSNDTTLIVRVIPRLPTVRQLSLVSSGDAVEINCTSEGGRPAANLRWVYNSIGRFGDQTTIVDDATNTSTVISLLKMTVTEVDNGQNVQCVVTHPVSTSEVSVNLTVQFSVKNISTSLTGNFKTVATGNKSLQLNCTTGSSNPASDIKWYNGTVEMQNNKQYIKWTGENNGVVRSQALVFYPTREMDGDKITCSVSNIENRQSADNDSVVLDLQYSPIVQIEGSRKYTVTEGGTIKLTCKVESKPRSTIRWYHNINTLLWEGKPLDNVHTLTIETVKRTHYGEYHCRASNGIGEEQEDHIFINVRFKPSTVNISGNSNTIANGKTQLTLLCTSGSSNPLSSILWKINKKETSSTKILANQNGDFGGLVRKAELTLTPTRQNDGDIISCEAYNSCGVTEISNEKLDLRYGPIIEQMSNVTTIEGNRSELLCSASSKPSSTFKWFKDGQNTILHQGTGALGNNKIAYVIPEVKREDVGLYKCSADNGFESPDKKEVFLSVNYPPDVTVVGSDSSVIAQRVILTCDATGVPDKNYRYGKWVHTWPGHNRPVSEKPGSETLTLTDLTYEHSGLYTCSASNGIRVFGTSQEFKEGFSQILIKSFPIITKFYEKASAKLKDTLNVEIEYYSNTGESELKLYKRIKGSRQEALVYSLSKTSKVVDLPVFTHIIKTTGVKATLSFTIKSKDDFGYYDVTVSNEVDSTVRELEIIPNGPPSVPYNITIGNIQQSTAHVSWQQGYHGGSDQTFLIQLSTDRSQWENVETVFGGKDETDERMNKVLTDLQHSTTYYVRMYSFNREGTSSFSPYKNFTTLLITDSRASSLPVGGIIGGTATAVVVIVIVVVIVVLVRRQTITKEGIRTRFQTVFSIFTKQNSKEEEKRDEHHDDNTYENSALDEPKVNQNQINLYEKLESSPSDGKTEAYDVIKVEKETAFDGKAVYENLPKNVCTADAFRSEITDKLNNRKPQIYENLKPRVKGAKTK